MAANHSIIRSGRFVRASGGARRAVWLVGALSWCQLAMAQQLVPGLTPFGAEGHAQVEVPQAAAPAPGDRVSVLVHLAPGADRAPVRQFAANQGGFVKYEYDILPNVINIRGISGNALNALLATPGVVRWEEDATVYAHMNDSTPLIRALQSQISAAGLSADGSGVRVCIIDTGIDSDSAMYSTRIDAAAGRDFVNGDNNPEDDNGHGSHVSGTAVGGDSLTVNFGCVGSEPFHGIAPEATLIGIKVLSSSGSGSFSNVIAGINYGANQTASGGRCDVINMSLGGGQFSGTCDGDSAAAAANNAVDAGVVVVASSGNNAYANAMGTPACGSKVISVGATYDDSYPSCEFPNQTSFQFCTCVNIFCCGTCTDNSPSVDQITCMSNRSSTLDVTAPGCITFSADYAASPNGIVGFCGTSMASPHVAGLAALLLSADPSLTPAEVRQHIRDGAIDLGAPGFDPVYGFGRIDAINSLSLLGPGCTTNGDCDDGNVCNGAETCVSGSCQAGTPLNCNDGNACTADSCNTTTGCVNTPISCNDGNACTADSCDAGSGCVNTPVNCDDGDACTADSCDSGTGACVNDPITPCCGNGSCESGENQCNCSADCGTPPAGESNCADGVDNDCDGATDCNDSDCSADPNCASFCGDGTCDPGEDQCNCPTDCGTPPATETNCADGIDNDCDGATDGDDSDCQAGTICGNGVCEGNGEDCFSCPSDCRCAGGGSCRACCGDGVCGGPGENANNCPVDCG